MRYDKEDLIAELQNHIQSSAWYIENLDLGDIWRALELALVAHKGQFRETGKEAAAAVPYIAHPVGVAKLCSKHFVVGELEDDIQTTLCVALLHDVLEDTTVEFATIEESFGRRVATLCEALTKPDQAEGLTRNERNELASIRILEAGSTAVFIKACDALHNIGRPSAMPVGLLRKTIEKVSGPYLRLISNQPFEERLSPQFSGALQNARETLSRITLQNDAKIYDLENLLEHLGTKARSKVYEEHDINALFLSIEGVVGSYIGHEEQIFANFNLNKLSFTQQKVASLKKTGTSQVVSNNFNDPDDYQSTYRVLSVPLFNPILADDSRRVVLIADSATMPNWLNADVLVVIVSALTERMLGRLRDRSLELAALISYHSLELDVRRAIELSLSVTDILDLADLNRLAEVAQHHLLFQLKLSCLTPDTDPIVERMECRIKGPISSFKKCRLRSLDSLDELDDFLGLRFVFLSSVEKNIFAKRLTDFLQDKEENRGVLSVTSENDFAPIQISSSSGYSATHMTFQVKSEGFPDIALGCEIQLRTIAEDAAARISHQISYKETSLSKSAVKKFNKEVTQLRARLDELIDFNSTREVK